MSLSETRDDAVQRSASIVRGLFTAFSAGGPAFLIVFFLGQFPLKLHAAIMAALAVMFAISESHYKNLLSELSALLRRGSYSVWQLEQLDQTVPRLRRRIAFIWALSTGLKAFVGLVCALLVWDDLPPFGQPVVLFAGYTCLFYSMILGIWGQRRFRELEREVDALTVKEARLKEKRRLCNELALGAQHDFSKDKLAQGYTTPPAPISGSTTV